MKSMNMFGFPTFTEDHGDNMCDWTNFPSKPGCIEQKAHEQRRFPLKISVWSAFIPNCIGLFHFHSAISFPPSYVNIKRQLYL